MGSAVTISILSLTREHVRVTIGSGAGDVPNRPTGCVPGRQYLDAGVIKFASAGGGGGATMP